MSYRSVELLYEPSLQLPNSVLVPFLCISVVESEGNKPEGNNRVQTTFGILFVDGPASSERDDCKLLDVVRHTELIALYLYLYKIYFLYLF